MLQTVVFIDSDSKGFYSKSDKSTEKGIDSVACVACVTNSVFPT